MNIVKVVNVGCEAALGRIYAPRIDCALHEHKYLKLFADARPMPRSRSR